MRIERLGWIGAKGAAAHCAGGELAAARSPDFAENGRPGLGFRRGSAWDLEHDTGNARAGSARSLDVAESTFDGEVARQGDGERTGMHGSERERGR